MKNFKDNKLVSIIIPVYNGDKYLFEAIDSAIKTNLQKYRGNCD